MGTNSKYFAVALAIAGVMVAATLLAFSDNRDAQWRITPSLSVNSVHFTIRQSNVFGNWSSTRDVPLDRFRGFSLSMLATPGPAKFEYVADAGKLLCEGRFLVGTGSGTYTFAPDRAFASSLQQMGYDTPDDEQLFSMLMMDINRDFAREIRDAGLRASVNDLIQLRIHGVTLDYVREARQAGYQNFSADDYVQLRIHGVDTNFLRELKAAGYDLRAGGHRATSHSRRGFPIPARPEELRAEARRLGSFADADSRRDARVLEGPQGRGLRQTCTVDEIDQLRIHGVDTRFVQQARRLGYDFTPEELAQLRIHGVDGAYLQRLQDAGMRNLNAEEIAKLRIHGVD